MGGGIPIVQCLGVALTANQIQGLAAIVNGTCNFILTRMTTEGLPYEEALRQAQSLGYAEADPTLDVDGTDTAHKLAILAQLAFEASVRLDDIPREGIDRLQGADIKYAGELGYAIKLLALAKLSSAGLELRVAPTLVRHGTPLAEVRGPYNAIRVVGDAVGDTLFYGRGAGALPTASAVVGDLIQVATGRAVLPSRLRDLWSEDAPAVPIASSVDIRSRYYLRFTIADRPGVLGRLAQILGDKGISIASVIQHDPGDDAPERSPVPLVIMTHHAIQADLQHGARGDRPPRRGARADRPPRRRRMILPDISRRPTITAPFSITGSSRHGCRTHIDPSTGRSRSCELFREPGRGRIVMEARGVLDPRRGRLARRLCLGHQGCRRILPGRWPSTTARPSRRPGSMRRPSRASRRC